MRSKGKNGVPIVLILFLISIFSYLINPLFTIIFSLLLIAYIVYKYGFLYIAMGAAKAYNQKDYEVALQKYKKAAMLKTANGLIMNNYAVLEMKKGSSQTAENFLSDVLNNKKLTDIEILSLSVSKSIALWRNGKKSEAISLLEEINTKSESTSVYETLSTLYIMNNNYDKAISLINKGLEYNDNSVILKSNLGEVNFKLGHYDNAEKLLSVLVDKDIKFIEPYYYYGLILKKKGNYDKAREMLEKSLTTNDSLLTVVTKEDSEKALTSLAFDSLN